MQQLKKLWHCAAEQRKILVVHGSNLLCHTDIELKWRVADALSTFTSVHPDELASKGALHLLAEKVSQCCNPCCIRILLSSCPKRRDHCQALSDSK